MFMFGASFCVDSCFQENYFSCHYLRTQRIFATNWNGLLLVKNQKESHLENDSAGLKLFFRHELLLAQR